MDDLIDRQAAIDALHTWFRDGFDEDKWWNSTHVLAAIEGLPSAQQGYKWETCFDCPLSHGCPKIKGCTNEQAIEYASQIPNDCPLSAQPDHVADVSKKAGWIPCSERLPERADNVIICYKAGDYTLVSTGRYLHKFKMWYVDVVGDLRDGVTAWMSLPEPYRGGEK